MLNYECFHIALLPDEAITLPPRHLRENISIIVTGDLTIAAKRNIAITNNIGFDYIALLDSDAYPDENWLKNGIEYLADHPDIGAIGGPNITPPEEPLWQRVVGNAQQSFLVSGPLYFAKKRSTSRYCNSLHSCNLILPHQIFSAVGGFDESLFTGEDRNLCDRIRKTGKQIYFHRDVLVYHHNRSLWRPFISQRFIYGYGSAAIGNRERNHYNFALYLPIFWLVFFLAFVLYDIIAASSMHAALYFALFNIAVAAFVAARVSASLVEFFPTLAAILICYLATTAGLLTSATGINLDLKYIYTGHRAASHSQAEKITELSDISSI